MTARESNIKNHESDGVMFGSSKKSGKWDPDMIPKNNLKGKPSGYFKTFHV